jgi:hypothetical protein
LQEKVPGDDKIIATVHRIDAMKGKKELINVKKGTITRKK